MAYIVGGGTSKAAAPTTLSPRRPAGPKVTYVVSQPAAAGGSAGGVGDSGGSLLDQASARAAADTAALVVGYQAQQQAALQQASLRAQQQGALGLGASRYLEGLHIPERTASDFSNAAAAQVAAAQGFQGGLQQTVGDAAQAVQRNLDVMGGGQTATNQSQAAGNALYALGGYLPSAQLGVAGPALAAGQRALPAQTLGFGQMLAQGELGAGQQEAAKYGADITSAYAKQPSLAATYLDALSKAATEAEQNRITNAFKQATLTQNAQIAQARIRQSAAEAQSRVDIANQKASTPHIVSSGGGVYAWSPTTGKLTTMKAPDPTSASLGIHYGANGEITQLTPNGITVLRAATAANRPTRVVSDSTGQWLTDSQTGERIARIGEAKPASTSTPNVQTFGSDARGWSYLDPKGNLVPLPGALGRPAAPKPNSRTGITTTLINSANKLIANAGAPEKRTYSVNPLGERSTSITPGRARTPYAEMVRQTIALSDTPGWAAKAVQLVNTNPKYAQGVNGRPFAGELARRVAAKSVKSAVAAGASRQTVLSHLQSSGLLPPDAIAWAMDRYFREPGLPPGVRGRTFIPAGTGAAIPTGGPVGPVGG